ncbi:MAG TPA: hypothetical protein VMW72_03450 [Sedimentisphaerales bacterium]|nr:hypothetical protein [Sedimentisphaerales bacterium]
MTSFLLRRILRFDSEGRRQGLVTNHAAEITRGVEMHLPSVRDFDARRGYECDGDRLANLFIDDLQCDPGESPLPAVKNLGIARRAYGTVRHSNILKTAAGFGTEVGNMVYTGGRNGICCAHAQEPGTDCGEIF